MEGLLFFRVYPSDGFRFILILDLPQVSLEWLLIGYIQFIMRSVLNLKRRTRETCKTRHSLIFTGNNNKISRGRESAGVLQKCEFAMANNDR
jgi:hypothetical protein